jgi:RNA polymerase sigma-70 factor (ECF subfamily)
MHSPPESIESVGVPGLAERARTGDPGAFDQLFRLHREAVARTVFLLLRDRSLAQDLAQEAFLVGWRDIRRLRRPEHFRAWVTGIAVNLCRRHRRAEIRERKRIRAAVPLAVQEAHHDPDLGVMVRRAVGELPRPMREALVLRFYAGFTEPEISVALRVPIGTVKSRLNRARRRLAEALGPAIEEERT